MRSPASIAVAALALAATCSAAAEAPLIPGLYEVEVRISLPNVEEVAKPLIITRCLTDAELESGRAFFVLSDNPLKACDLLDFEATGGRATYRIACAGPNRGHAMAGFDVREKSYRGTIRMNMGGKNMTMSESQAARRVGDCAE